MQCGEVRHLVVEHVVSNVNDLLIYRQECQLSGVHPPLSQAMQNQVKHLCDANADGDIGFTLGFTVLKQAAFRVGHNSRGN